MPVEDITDAEITSAIGYLDPHPPSHEGSDDHADTVLVIWVGLIVLFAGGLAYIMLYLRTS